MAKNYSIDTLDQATLNERYKDFSFSNKDIADTLQAVQTPNAFFEAINTSMDNSQKKPALNKLANSSKQVLSLKKTEFLDKLNAVLKNKNFASLEDFVDYIAQTSKLIGLDKVNMKDLQKITSTISQKGFKELATKENAQKFLNKYGIDILNGAEIILKNRETPLKVKLIIKILKIYFKRQKNKHTSQTSSD